MKRSLWLAALVAATSCQPCVDFKQPAPYHCTYGGSPDQCPGGWRCGVGGQCFDPDAGAALPCNTTGDCPSDWRCGEAKICFDPADGGPLPCSPDAGGSDCARGWRCGLNGVCHEIDAGAPYACATDLDCEAGWRCNEVTFACVAVPGELLQDAGIGSLAVWRSSPPLTGSASVVAAANSEFADSSLFNRYFAGGVAAALDGGVFWGTLNLPQSPPAPPSFSDVTFTPWPAPILALSVAPSAPGSEVLVLDDRGLWSLSPGSPDAGFLWPSLGERSLRRTSLFLTKSCGYRCSETYFDDLAVAFSPGEFTFMDLTQGLNYVGQTLPAIDGGSQVIYDMAFGAWAAPGQAASGTWLFAAGDEGLFATPALQNGGPIAWAPINTTFTTVAWDNAFCGSASTVADRLESFNEPSLDGSDAGGNWIAGRFELAEGPRWYFDPGTSDVGPPSCSYTTPVPLGNYGETDPLYSICPAGFELDHLDGPLAMSGADSGVTFVAACRAPSGPMRIRFTEEVANTGPGAIWADAVRPSTFFSDLAAEQQDVGGFFAGVGQHGQLWLDSQSGVDPAALFLDQRPSSVGLFGDAGAAAIGQGQIYAESGFGLSPLPALQPPPPLQPPVPEAFVQGRPDLLLVAGGAPPTFSSAELISPDWSGLTTGQVAALIEGTNGPLSEPFLAGAVALDGGDEVLVASSNALYAGQLLDGGAPTLPFVAILPSQVPISSMTFSPGSSGHLLDGYALSTAGLFQVAARTTSVWTVNPVSVPIGQWVKVWSDGARPRLGYADGTVVGLPEPVLLAQPPPTPACPGEIFVDYADFCGQTFALSSCNLYRLVPDGRGGGTWSAEPSIWSAGFGDRDLAGGALAELPQSLYVFSRFGEAVALVPSASCP